MKMKLEDVEKHIGQQIKMLRMSNKMSQKVLAEHLGITYQQVQKYETGMNRISVARIWQFCKIFSVKPDFLFKNLLDLNDENASAGELIPNNMATSQDIRLMLSFKKMLQFHLQIEMKVDLLFHHSLCLCAKKYHFGVYVKLQSENLMARPLKSSSFLAILSNFIPVYG